VAQADQDRAHDIVLFGATGFTGKLVAEELMKTREPLRWAIAGRDARKLEAVRHELAAIGARARELPILVADSHDRPSLDVIARQARVVCTTVGPYAQHGSDLVAACAAAGTHYCDLTGEAPWIRRMIDAHHQTAVENGARIVHCCGFDSIPSDLGCLVLQREMRARHGAPCEAITLHVKAARGGASGGTIASMLGIIDEARRDPSVRRLLLDPYGLNPEGERSGPDRRDKMAVELDRERGRVLAPFVMAAINTRIVRRSNAVLGWPYGRDFRYREVMSFPLSPRGWLMASATAAGVIGLAAGASLGPTRQLLQRMLPKPGEGPSREQRERGYFRIELVGERRDADGRGQIATARVGADRDPGYGFTAVMLAQSALCLALDERHEDTLPGGVLTPASAMGMRLVERLRAAGMTIEAD
jgi:short subunit dehydrogenase-like uncharacterized protein